MLILITGAAGFIGTALCSRLASRNEIIGVDITGRPTDCAFNIAWEQSDLSDVDSVTAIFKKYSPDVVVHCAGIAHQKIGAVDSATYMRVNSVATEDLARTAVWSNPDVCFIFLSSVSVYGEYQQMPSDNGVTELIKKSGIDEDGECRPSSDYAASKLDAERRLRALYDKDKLRNLVILRLAPVYDREWSLNLDRRVFAPWKVAYLRFGSGSQRMSALARPNLVEFIVHILQSIQKDKKNLCNRRNLRINVSDAKPYDFNSIIRVFKKSDIHRNKPVISVPLSVVWFATRIAGIFFPDKREWLHSCHDKLASDLVFDNGRMVKTGFKVVNSIETIFLSEN